MTVVFHSADDTIRAAGPVMAYFYAGWSDTAAAAWPAVERVAAANAGRITLAKIDFEANMGLASAYDVTRVPEIVFIQDGDKVVSLHLSGDAAAIESALQNYIDVFLETVADTKAAPQPRQTAAAGI